MNRKRGIKIAGLGLCLTLCLALSGCYIAPDDISSDSSKNTNSGSLHFQTLAPTATAVITPDTVAVETQNVFGDGSLRTIAVTDTSQRVTAAPDSGNAGAWSDWATVGTTGEGWTPETSTPDSSVIVLVTRTPNPGIPISLETAGTMAATEKPTIQVVTAAPATSTPVPQSLQLGFTGSAEVRALQKRLKELGYYSGSVDGDFGKGTETAVKAFQKANGLTADGKAGKQTLEKLNSKNAVSKAQSEATPTKKPTATPTKKPTATPTPKYTATPRPTSTPDLSKEYYLQTGASGNRVRTLQNRLIELGYLDGKATGEYDAATRKAVMAFQKKTKGLYDDGVAGPETLKALYSSGAAKASSVAASTGETLELGSTGDAVRALQKRLKELGYLSGTVDGSYGAATEAAVTAFQRQNGLTADGKAGNATLNAIYAQEAQRYNGGSSSNSSSGSSGSSSSSSSGTSGKRGRDTSGISSTGYATLEQGSSGDAVRTLQQKLKDLRYYNGRVDGSFGEDTAAAVMAFQLRNNLTVDGKAGPATQRALYGSTAAVPYTALREGENGAAVKVLQYTLYELGYYDGSIDGIYGATTSDAVRAFQIQNSLKPVDGVAGSNTLARLYSSEAIPATAATVDYDTARPGDSGELVVEIQDCLVQMEYLDRITGTYDEATEEAVKAFQRDNGLTPDGVAGSRTLVLLFGY